MSDDHIADTSKKAESTCDLAALLEEAEGIEDTIGRHEGKGGAWDKILAKRAERARNLRLAAAELWLGRRGKSPSGTSWERYDGECRCRYMLPSVIFDNLEGVNKLQVLKGYGTTESAWAAAIEATARVMEEGRVEL